MRQWGFGQRNKGGIGGVKGRWGMVFFRVKGVYIAGLNGRWVVIMELMDVIQGVNVLLRFP